MIDFNVPPYVGTEMDYVREAAEVNHKICGDGPFSRKCHAWMEGRFNAEKVLLTTSGTFPASPSRAPRRLSSRSAPSLFLSIFVRTR